MKFTKVLLAAALLCIVVHKTTAQCETPLFGVPDEFVTNRFKEDGMAYGHPYTIFNKRNNGNVNFSLKAELT